MRPARPASPIASSWSVALGRPAALPRPKQSATNTTQSAIARQGWVALHRAILTVTGFLSTVDVLPGSFRRLEETLWIKRRQDIRERPWPGPDSRYGGRLR